MDGAQKQLIADGVLRKHEAKNLGPPGPRAYQETAGGAVTVLSARA